jgi:DNA-binding response OmpR family regulator
MQVLVVEDDPRLAALVMQALTEDGHVVITSGDGDEALAIIRESRFDAIVLDVMLPGTDGISVARKVRASGNRVPILILTARDRVNDIVAGLDSGADDYVTKPFALDELLARIRALGRRGPVTIPVILAVGDLVLDTGGRVASRAGTTIALTRKQYTLLELLMRNAGRVVTRDAILAGVWGYDSEVEANTLEAFVSTLRARIDQGFGRKLIHTVRGVGYVIREQGE